LCTSSFQNKNIHGRRLPLVCSESLFDLSFLIHVSWRCRQHLPPNDWFLRTKIPSVKCQKTDSCYALFILHI
jgi:hypothetical protein